MDYFCGKGTEALNKIIERREPETLHEVGCENTARHLVWRLLLADQVSVNTNISPDDSNVRLLFGILGKHFERHLKNITIQKKIRVQIF